MPTYRFEEVTYPVKRRVPCAGGCGKKLTRQTTLSQTINPFNKNPDGSIKTRADIWQALRAEAETWQPSARSATCAACAENAGASA